MIESRLDVGMKIDVKWYRDKLQGIREGMQRDDMEQEWWADQASWLYDLLDGLLTKLEKGSTP